MLSVLTLDVKVGTFSLDCHLPYHLPYVSCLMSAGGWPPGLAQGTWRSSQGAL